MSAVHAPSSAQIASEFVVDGLEYPVLLTAPPGDTNRLFVVEQRGAIRIIENGQLLPTPFLDIDPLVYNVTGSDERGMAGLTFHPDYDTNGYFFIAYYNVQNQSVVVRYSVSGDPNLALPDSDHEILVLDQPHGWHNVYHLAFGPDDYLYIGSGDGGWWDDPDNNGQRDDTLFGKILRIDVDGGTPYAIPPSNPFAGAGLPLDEIWAKGLRNPYRFHFDALTGDLYIGDVGQGTWEELNFQPAGSAGGENYGWVLMEGPNCYIPPVNCEGGETLTAPVHAYMHGGEPYRCSISGGAVYHGAAIPAITGLYFFADYCSAQIWSLRMVNGSATELVDWTAALDPGGGRDLSWIASISVDAAGELYVLDREDGEIFKIVSTTTAVAPDPAPSAAGVLLSAARPSPFSTTTFVDATFLRDAPYDIRVYSAAGRLVRELATGALAGDVRVSWDGRDEGGAPVAAGVYLVRARQGTDVQRRSILLVR